LLIHLSPVFFFFLISDLPTTIRLSPLSAYFGRSFKVFGLTVCRPSEVFNNRFAILLTLQLLNLSFFLSGADAVDDDTPKGLARHRLNQIISEVPRRGMFDLRLVLDSVYFFS
jgi:DNA-directed RNA polymerase